MFWHDAASNKLVDRFAKIDLVMKFSHGELSLKMLYGEVLEQCWGCILT